LIKVMSSLWRQRRRHAVAAGGAFSTAARRRSIVIPPVPEPAGLLFGGVTVVIKNGEVGLYG
jgi:hypothetical protein